MSRVEGPQRARGAIVEACRSSVVLQIASPRGQTKVPERCYRDIDGGVVNTGYEAAGADSVFGVEIEGDRERLVWWCCLEDGSSRRGDWLLRLSDPNSDDDQTELCRAASRLAKPVVLDCISLHPSPVLLRNSMIFLYVLLPF
jgi:hypothetical protein